MVKRLLVCFFMLIFVLPLGGCWNYISLDQMKIVVGIAVDFDKENKLFDLSYEVAELSEAGKNKPVTGTLIRSEGKTVFAATRNAKRKEADKLFLGTPNVVILSQDLVKEVGVLSVLDWFLRDEECRESMSVIISQEKTAAEILMPTDEVTGLVSTVVHDIIRKDSEVVGATYNARMYEIYNVLHSPRKSAVLPLMRKVQNGKEKTPEANGTAIIKEDRLVGFLSPEQSLYIQLVEEKLKNAILTLSIAGLQTDDLSLEIFFNQAKKSYTYEQGQITVKIETNTRVSIAESQGEMELEDEQLIKKITEAASQKIEENILRLVDTLQHEFNADIFGFGELIYKKDLKLWKQLSSSWDEIYPNVKVEVSSEVKVINTALNI